MKKQKTAEDGWFGAPRETNRRTQELAALVEQGLLDHLICSDQQ